MFRSVLASRTRDGQGGKVGSGAEPNGRGDPGRSGQLESIELTAARGSARAGKPRWDLGDHGRMLDACPEPVEGAAMIFKVPPHWGHCSMSISNTRLSSRAQLMGPGAGGGTSPWSAEGYWR